LQNLAIEQNSTITELEDKATLYTTENEREVKSLTKQLIELEKKNTEQQKQFIEFEKQVKKQLKKQQEEINGLKQSVSSIKQTSSVKKSNVPSKKVISTPQKVISEKKPSTSEWKTFTLTFYSNSPDQGTDGTTASGTHTTEGRTIACDPSIMPLGTVVEIEGLGKRVCEDTGSAINGPILDVFVESKSKAFDLGRQQRKIRVIK
jgi:3D (Asp-Asp-Asp) domain-containing protein